MIFSASDLNSSPQKNIQTQIFKLTGCAIAEKITIEIFKMADLCREKLFFTYCFNLHFSETARDPSLILTMYVLIVMKIIV